jgi:uncharacterized protein
LARARAATLVPTRTTIAVFIKDPEELWDELGHLAHITTDIFNETGAVVSAKPFHAGAYRERSPLMHEIRNDGHEL